MKRLILMLGLASAGAVAAPLPVARGAVEARAKAMFERADANHDGLLSRAEYQASVLAVARHYDPHVPATGPGMDHALAQYDLLAKGAPGVPERVFVDAALAHFDGADLNHNGVVTPDEARKAAKIKQRALDAAKPVPAR